MFIIGLLCEINILLSNSGNYAILNKYHPAEFYYLLQELLADFKCVYLFSNPIII